MRHVARLDGAAHAVDVLPGNGALLHQAGRVRHNVAIAIHAQRPSAGNLDCDAMRIRMRREHEVVFELMLVAVVDNIDTGIDLGVAHFRALGAQATPVMLLTRDDAQDQQVLADLRGADMYYFSGGNPEHVIETLRDTPAWQIIRAGYAAGAVLAGCSAGAMMLGGYTLSVRAVMRGQPPRWLPGFGVAPGIVLMPHFDRVADFAGAEMFRAILAAAPPDTTLVGVDEDTALVHLPSDAKQRWRVIGRQTVSVFDREGGRAIYRAGDAVALGPL